MREEEPLLPHTYDGASPRQIAWYVGDLVNHLILVGMRDELGDQVDGYAAARIVVAARALLNQAERRARKEGRPCRQWFSPRDL